jgi:hypothetical protein
VADDQPVAAEKNRPVTDRAPAGAFFACQATDAAARRWAEGDAWLRWWPWQYWPAGPWGAHVYEYRPRISRVLALPAGIAAVGGRADQTMITANCSRRIRGRRCVIVYAR